MKGSVLEVRVRSMRDGVVVSDAWYDIGPHVDEIRARNERTGRRFEQDEDAIIGEVVWKIFGPDFDASEEEKWLWDVDVLDRR